MLFSGEPASEEDQRLASEELQINGALMCPRCQEQFTDIPEFLTHKAECARKAKEHADESAHSDPEDMVVSEDDDYDSETGGKRLERMRRHRQDAANNNSVDEDNPSPRMEFPFPVPPVPGHVTLEALQNTKVAVAQFAATAMANNADNEAALQELAVLQSTLFTLQHQQVLQLQLINQLQQQLSINRSKANSPVSQTEENDSEPIQSESPPPPPEIMPIPKESPSTPIPPPTSQSTTLQSNSEPPAQIVATPILPPQIQVFIFTCQISFSLQTIQFSPISNLHAKINLILIILL